jgi:hypothetical protein
MGTEVSIGSRSALTGAVNVAYSLTDWFKNHIEAFVSVAGTHLVCT